MPGPAQRRPWLLLRPRYWLVHLLALTAAAAAVGLGVWQWHSWSDRRATEAANLTHERAVPLTRAIGPDDPFPADQVGRPVRVTGRWLPGGTVYVSGRPGPGGRGGYWAVTPVEVDGTSSAVLVVRGWAPSVAAAPGPPTGATTLTGWLQPSEGARVDDSDRTDDVLPQLRVADAIQHVDVDLFGAYVVLDPARASGNAGDAGLDRARLVELPDAGRFTAVRNLFYALEWWVFAGFALFVWWRWARDEVTAADGSAAPDPADEEVAAGS